MTGSNSEGMTDPSLVRVIAVDAGVRGIARLVTRVGRLTRSVAPRGRHQEIFLEDELIARIVGRRVVAGVHANGVARAGLDAESAEDAAKLVDDERPRKALVAAPLVALRILGRLNADALRGTSRRAAEARDAARRSVVAKRE